MRSILGNGALDVSYDVTYGLDALNLLVGYLYVKLIFYGADQVNYVERICTEIVNDRSLCGYLVSVNIELVYDNITDLFKYHCNYLLLDYFSGRVRAQPSAVPSWNSPIALNLL